MLSASHWLLSQARFCGRTHLPLSPNSTTSTDQLIFWYLQLDAPVFNIHYIHSTCGHGDISAIALLTLSLSGCSCLNILWYTAPVDMMTFWWSRRSYQSICQTTSIVFTPAGHVKILNFFHLHLKHWRDNTNQATELTKKWKSLIPPYYPLLLYPQLHIHNPFNF